MSVQYPTLRRCSHRLLGLLGGVLAFYMVGDFVSTYLSLHAGGVETNPLSRYIIRRFGYAGFFVAKLAEVAYISGACVYLDATVEWRDVAPTRPRLQAALSRFPVAVAFLYAGLGMYLTVNNTLVLVDLTT